MIPPVMPDYRYDGERDVALRLRDDPGAEGWIVLHSLDVADHRSQVMGECDFVVIIPERGVLFVEVKGCKSLDVKEGLWYYGKKKKGDSRGPFKQVSESMHSLREYVSEKNLEFNKIVYWSCVIFPYIPFHKKSPEWHDWQLIDAHDYISRPISQLLRNVLDQARIKLRGCRNTNWFDSASLEPTSTTCTNIADLLRPRFECYESPASRRKNLSENLKRYTKEQFVALDSMRDNTRVIFNGPAGTGKTLLAIEAARRSVANGQRTLFLCFNKLISEWIKSQFSPEYDSQLLTISTLHSHMMKIAGLKTSSENSTKFWTEELPEKAIDRLLGEERTEYSAYDFLVIDEMQDCLREEYLDFLDLMLVRGLAAGRWNFFGDFVYQQIYSSSDMTLGDYVKTRSPGAPIYSLTVNCRNTPRIAAYAPLLGGLDPDYSSILRPDDKIKPELHYYGSAGQQKVILADLLEKFRNVEKFKGEEIVILSPFGNSCCAAEVSSPWDEVVKPRGSIQKGGYIQYYTIHSFKGLEAPVVIVTDISGLKDLESRNLLYIAVTRSLARLVILISESAKKDIKKTLGVD